VQDTLKGGNRPYLGTRLHTIHMISRRQPLSGPHQEKKSTLFGRRQKMAWNAHVISEQQ